MLSNLVQPKEIAPLHFYIESGKQRNSSKKSEILFYILNWLFKKTPKNQNQNY